MENIVKNPFVWCEIYVDDLARARKFYEEVLQAPFEEIINPTTDDSLAMLGFPSNMEESGCSGALVKMDGVKAGGNSTLMYFGSEDCAIEEARIENAGGKIFKPKMSIGDYGFISLAMDTEGNMIGFHSMK